MQKEISVFHSRGSSESNDERYLSITPEKRDRGESFLKELRAYAELSGAYILKMFAYSVHQPAGARTMKCMLVMELMSRGSLKSIIEQKEKISLRRKLSMACHIASGMRKLHQHQMIHRDIRPDNILVDKDYTAKIGDMGIARDFDSKQYQHMTMIGCQPFMPPEFYTGKYDQSLDVFTFGLTLYELIVGTQHGFNRLTRQISLPLVIPVFEELIKQCTHTHPSQRPLAIEIDTTLHVYKQAFDKAVISQHSSYTRMSTEQKDSIFIKFYAAFHPQAKAELERKFPPPPPPSSQPAPDSNDQARAETLRQLFLRVLQGKANDS